MSGLLIRQDVREFEPSVNAANIGIAVENGVATLTGHVESYMEKAAAEHIEIRHPERKKRVDDEIATRAFDIITCDTALPDGAVDVKVERGCVILSG
ncbi:BON domain-containing protein [Rhizobium puerariae]|uniref:BON domain-containing protein n=1 Tax=Rhizobium puerariae TaxID=1585791 RepID=A0ABV6AJ16_9HYPH